MSDDGGLFGAPGGGRSIGDGTVVAYSVFTAAAVSLSVFGGLSGGRALALIFAAFALVWMGDQLIQTLDMTGELEEVEQNPGAGARTAQMERHPDDMD